MAIRRNDPLLHAEGIGDLPYVEVPAGIDAQAVGRDEVAGSASIRTDPAKEDIPLPVEHGDVSGQIVPDRSVRERLLTDLPPKA